jgi:acetylornithine deacetylase
LRQWPDYKSQLNDSAFGIRRLSFDSSLMSTQLPTLLAQLVAIDSVNPDLVPGGAGEGAVAAFIAQWCREAGLEVHSDEVQPGRPNVIAIAKGTGGGKTLMLNGHIDTVGVAGMTAPHTPRLENGRMYGRGAYDMKCGVAACMLAVAEARKKALRGDVIFTAVADEEFAGTGTIDVAKRYTADAAIVTEPTEMQLVVAHKGFAWFTLHTHGVAAHGSRPDLGVDAIAHMGRVLVELDALNHDLLANPTHVLLKSGSLHASLIQGGQEWSSYPERCTLSVERRTVPGETVALAEAQITSILARLGALDPTFNATCELGVTREPMETAPDAPIPTLIQKHGRAITGHAIDIVGAPYWTDAASLAEAGIPAVLFGPRGAGAHAIEEWVDLASVQQCAEIYGHVIDAFCA